MSAKIVYVVYGSRSEISQLIAFLVSGEMCFHYSGEYLYFSYDPTELIKEAGMDRSCKHGMLFPVGLLMANMSECPNFELDIEKVKESLDRKEVNNGMGSEE